MVSKTIADQSHFGSNIQSLFQALIIVLGMFISYTRFLCTPEKPLLMTKYCFPFSPYENSQTKKQFLQTWVTDVLVVYAFNDKTHKTNLFCMLSCLNGQTLEYVVLTDCPPFHFHIKTSLLRRLQAQPLPDEAPPKGKINPFSKNTVTFEPVMQSP